MPLNLSTFLAGAYKGDLGYTGSIGFTGSQGQQGDAINWIYKTANYTAAPDDAIIADTSGGSFTVSLPATPALNDVVVIADGSNWYTNSLTVSRNGNTINGDTSDMIVDIGLIKIEFVYDGTTWKFYPTAGPKGEPGTSILIKGSVATVGDLPTLDVLVGDSYIVTFDGKLYMWSGTAWTDLGAIRGPIGYHGSKGFTGSRGLQGYTGSRGFNGSKGFTGSRGDTGFTGSRGFNGSRGFTGSRGIQGFTGSRGVQGFTGSRGFTGSQGAGFTGSRGDTGFTGSRGYNGSRGFTGSRGSTGFVGSRGLLGYTGSRGFNGSRGFTGSRGSTGFVGSQGVIGNASPRSITIDAPTATEKMAMFYTTNSLTISKIVSVCPGGVSPSVTFYLYYGSDISTTGTAVVTAGMTVTSTTTGLITTSFNNATIPANNFLWITTTAKSGEVPTLTVSVEFA